MDPKFWFRSDEHTGIQYLVSTKRSLIDLDFVNASFASKDMFWAKPLPIPVLATMLDNSLTLGLYVYEAPKFSNPTISQPPNSSIIEDRLTQIGMARFVTDHVSFAWLTDVYILPVYQGKGLGKWLISCCKDNLETIKESGGLRRALLITSNTVQGVPLYQRLLGMVVHDPKSEMKIMSTTKE